MLCAETIEYLSIDFCYGGDNTLKRACRGKDLKPEEVLCKLQWIENLKKEQVADLDSLTH